jgi:hypothetical protein
MSKQHISPIPPWQNLPTCPHCGSTNMKSAQEIYEEGTFHSTYIGYSLSAGRYRGSSTLQSTLAQRANRPTAPTLSAISVSLWIAFWVPGMLWELFYCLTGGISQQTFVASSIKKFFVIGHRNKNY